MFNLLKTKTDLKQLEVIAKTLARKSIIGDIYLLSGELGAGKTTFIRELIGIDSGRYKYKQKRAYKNE